ncbi:C-terminal binding protein [uncultured Streptomyces sp.]|uniref:C-terminal binding protein n=1 Tax=uncultured Streptomyces sp. TaxID=174707 RepID=UPI0026189E22|nr:C-terminal binding protein [uncultured Streptomyces sp.]
MSTFKVLVTDHAWPTLDVETSVLARVDAELVVAKTGETAELVRLAENADAILTCFANVSQEVLDAAPRCLTVARYGVGVDNIDVDHATRLGMIVSNVPDYCSEEVADHALLMLLALSRRLLPLARQISGGGWDGTAVPTPVRLRGKVLGLVGLGTIGRALVPRAQALGMDVIALQRRTGELPDGVRAVSSREELLAEADVVSLHCPLTSDTRGLIGAAELATMKPTAVLLNTARGPLVDTEALVAALERGDIAGAGLDVTDPEPLPADHPLRHRADVVITPHVAFSSDGSLAELARKAATNAADVLLGRTPATVVNPAVLDSPALRPALEDRS